MQKYATLGWVPVDSAIVGLPDLMKK